MLRKNPGFATVVVITLALGIGANTAIFSFVNAVILNPLPFPDSDRLVVISEISKEGAEIGVSLLNFRDFQVRAKSFEEIGGYRFDTFNLSGIGSPQRLIGQEVTGNYFRILGVQPQLGRTFTEEEEKVALLVIGNLDDDGYLWFQGRNDDMFKTAGYRVGPAEIENCLVKHAAVANAAVIPIPDETRGAVIKAFVLLAPGQSASPALEDSIRAHVKQLLAPYQQPREIEFVDEGFDIGIRQSWERAIEDVKAKGGKPYAIPSGASVHKYGGLGFVGFAEEVRAQEQELGFKFDFIIVCTVTGSTHAGMLVGFAKDGRSRNVIGIDASGTLEQTRAQVLDIARNTAGLVELGREITDDDLVLFADYAYPAYGVPSAETNDAIRLAARMEGMMTDPVYEGKSMQGMIDLVRKGYFPVGSKILYAHLGGVPAINLSSSATLRRQSGTWGGSRVSTRTRGWRGSTRGYEKTRNFSKTCEEKRPRS